MYVMDTAAPMRHFKWPALFLLLALLLGGVAGRPRVAEAHATLVASEPAAGSALTALPGEIRLAFSETVDPALSSISLVAADGAAVELTTATVDPSDHHVLVAKLQASSGEPGVYTVIWGAFSAEDGHASSGSFTFSAQTGESPPQPGAQTGPAGTWSVLGKWLELFGFVLLTGLAFFAASSETRAGRTVATALSILALIGLAGAAFSLWVRATAIGGEDLRSLPDPSTLTQLTAATYGHAWLVRVVAGLTALALSWFIRRGSTRRMLTLVTVCGVLALGSIAASGHAGAVDRTWLATGIDWFHMLAAALWLGGLLGLLLVLSPDVEESERRALLHDQGNRFAAAALIIVGAGIATASWHVDGRWSLRQTDYGRTLLLKIALVSVLLGVAFYNRRVVQGARGRIEWVPLAIGSELALAGVVLLLSADLSQTPPGTQPLQVQVAARAIELDQTASSGASTVTLSGVLTGDPTDTVQLLVEPATELQRVIVRTQLTPVDGGQPVGDRFDAAAAGERPGVFVFPAGRLGIAGPWTLEVTVRRAGVQDDVVTFPLDTSSLAVRSITYAPDRWGGFQVTSHTALALMLAVLMAVVGLGGLRRITGLEPLASAFLLAAALLIAGGFLVSAVRSVVPVTPDHALPNPADTSPGALVHAGELYRLNCAVCHGVDGTGPGTSNLAHLHGNSADLSRDQTVAQSDGDLRYWIANGVPGTRMPAFDPAVTADEQWTLVRLIRQFQAEAQAARANE